MNELVGELASKLGIKENQAKGGAGLIFDAVRERLGGDFSKLAKAVPGVQDMMAASPEGGGAQSAGGGLEGGMAPHGVGIPANRSAPRGPEVLGEGAVQGGGAGGLRGGVMGEFGGGGATVAEMAHLAGGFSKLGLEPGMIGKFIPIIVRFVRRQGSDEASDLLAKALQR